MSAARDETQQATEPVPHQGNLISGQVTCSCGWKSEHYALASDAIDDYDQHLRDGDDDQ